MTARLCGGRHAGLLLPLFSFPSRRSWGIGEIGDLAPMTGWLRSAGQDILQLLPLNEMAPGQQSPYSAISAMAIDPLFITVPDVEDFAALGGEASLQGEPRHMLAAVRQAPVIDYRTVRALKQTAMRAAFDRFRREEWSRGTDRADAFRLFLAEQAWWIEDYALFRAVHAQRGGQAWTTWPDGLQRREPAAVLDARTTLKDEVLYWQYLQWIADGQWRIARQQAGSVELMGDLPFMVGTDSADVWSRQEDFRLDASVGVPPDAFSTTGQDWGMPVYRWDVLARTNYHWLRERARRAAQLYAGYRIDHLVGFYRTYARPHDGSPAYFSPADEREQTTLGETLLTLFKSSGACVVAEDLGLVPDFVRASLARMGVPGYKVLRWEREWHVEGQPYRDPIGYPPVSLATSGTHDTEPMATWWDGATREEREALGRIPIVQQLVGAGFAFADSPYTTGLRDVLVQALFASGSNLIVLPAPDVFGWSDRINTPGTVDERNWTFRLPWYCDELDAQPEAAACRDHLRAWSQEYRRGL
ncbi:MAG TPA: 4-alpha-glucanotransferase [Vicinamibacterales bacterium]|nr:4-alpha-glucanotransferase [Vicinamibacterales bacterium]